MASVTPLGKGKYKLYVELGYDGRGKRIRKTKTIKAKNPTEAKKKLAVFEAEVYTKQLTDPSKVTLDMFYLDWQEKYAKHNYGKRTLIETKNIIENRLLPKYGGMKLPDIKKIHMVHFFDDLQKPGMRLDGKEGLLSPSSIHNIYKAVNSLFSVAEEWELIERNPCTKIKLPKLKHKKSEIYDMKEAERLFAAMENKPLTWQLIVQLAIVSGARAGEIAALEGKHLNTKKNVLTIEQALSLPAGGGIEIKSTKSDRTRKVSVPSELMKALDKLRELKEEQKKEVKNLWQYPKNLFLFSDEYGKPLRPDSIAQWWMRFMNEERPEGEKLKKIRFHDLRHTSASLLINSKKHVSARLIQERLGHANITTTMNTYGHVFEEADQSAAAEFDVFFEKN